jgi:Zn-dependent protease with chaperone function
MRFFERQQSARRRSRFYLLPFVLLTIPCVIGVYVATLFSVAFIANVLLARIGIFPDPEADSFWPLYLVSGIFYTAIVLMILITRKRMQLHRTDRYVARELGAQRVDARTATPAMRRVVNIAEEMALAAGIAPPTVYVWQEHRIVNSFTIGENEADASIFVSRGAVDVLTRDEMQALVGYGMSQILNGDMALNIRLASYVYAFKFAPRVTNFFLAFPSGQKGGKYVESLIAWIFIYLWIGVALAIVTYPQWLAARILQWSIGRERQKLADASMMQFTRNPGAIEGLFLKALAFGTAAADRSRLLEDLAHACFATPYAQRGGFLRMHRPFEKRLRALDPRFDVARIPDLIAQVVREVEREEEGRNQEMEARARQAEQTRRTRSMVETIGGFMPAVAAAVAETPARLTALAASGDARAMLIALLLDARSDVRHKQLAAVRQLFGDESMLALAHSVRAVGSRPPLERTVELDKHLPQLRELSRVELRRLSETLRALEAADDSIDLFEYAITRRALVFIHDLLEPRMPHGHRPLTELADELQLVFSVIAHHGAHGTGNAAYEKGMRRMSMQLERAYLPTARWGKSLDAALDRLDQLKPAAKELLIEGLRATVEFDQHESGEERELLRVFAASLHFPLPREVAPAVPEVVPAQVSN